MGDTGQALHKATRTLAVKLHLDPHLMQRLRDLSWQAARYRNLQLRARWCEAMGYTIDHGSDDPHQVSKRIRHEEKRELSGAVYSAAEQEVQAVWTRHKARILAGAPLPEWKPTAALSVRGHTRQQESGVRLRLEAEGHLTAHLLLQAHTCEGGSWLVCPVAAGTVKDLHASLLTQMVAWEVPIRKATLQLQPARGIAILRLTYTRTFVLPPMGERHATLGPIEGHRLLLRLPTETRDYSGRLHTILTRKDQWDHIRRRAMAQIGHRKGAARTKRQVLARLSWQDWLDTALHQWSHELVTWLADRGVSTLHVVGLDLADWPASTFVERLTYKGAAHGLTVTDDASLADATTARAATRSVATRRTRVRKTAQALRTLTYHYTENGHGP